MSEGEITRLDTIVEVLGERESEIQRLVTLDDRIRTFAESGDEDGQRMSIELIAGWAMLLDKYYPLTLERRNSLDWYMINDWLSFNEIQPIVIYRSELFVFSQFFED